MSFACLIGAAVWLDCLSHEWMSGSQKRDTSPQRCLDTAVWFHNTAEEMGPIFHRKGAEDRLLVDVTPSLISPFTALLVYCTLSACLSVLCFSWWITWAYQRLGVGEDAKEINRMEKLRGGWEDSAAIWHILECLPCWFCLVFHSTSISAHIRLNSDLRTVLMWDGLVCGQLTGQGMLLGEEEEGWGGAHL